MKINPLLDTWNFIIHDGPLWPVFLLLFLVSLVIATINLVRNPEQRSITHLWNWFTRICIGGLWWEQSLWKTPPAFGVSADGTGGLRYWMDEMVKNASTPAQSHLVSNVILPHFTFFAYQVYAGEVFVAVLLMPGLFDRVSAIVGALMALNLWLGLYRNPSEWAWEYFFLIVIQVTFLIVRPGRSWGADALLIRQPLGRFDWLNKLT